MTFQANFFDPTKELEAKRRRKLAEQLMESGKQPTGTEMVSGYAVPQSPLAALAKALQTGLGGYQEGQANKLEEEAARQRAELYQQAISGGDRMQAASMLAQDPNSQEQALKIAFPTSYLGGATGALADRLIAAGVPELDALLIAKSGAGVGRGYDPNAGKVVPMAGAPEAGRDIKYGESRGTQDARVDTAAEIKRQEMIGEGKIPEISKKETGQTQFNTVLSKLSSAYDELENAGAAVSTENDTLSNISAAVRGGPVGQYIGKKAGTKEQSIRNKIAQSRPALINAIRQATGMSAKAMDSNVELQFYLQQATDPTLDVQANRAALQTLQEMYAGAAAQESTTQSPMEGAQQAPDGNWYIQKDGKYFKVE